MTTAKDIIHEVDAWDRNFEENAKCLISSGAGIYIPKEFAKGYDMEAWHVDVADTDILKDGAEHEFYWDTWDYVLDNAYFIDSDGKRWTLYQDDDLFVIPDID